MFSKKKKKPQISLPSNFEHRVHTGFDKKEGKYIGLPLQWASIVGNNQILKSSNRPLPLVDPSAITPTEILDLKTIVRPQSSLATSIGDSSSSSLVGPDLHNSYNGFNLPKISHVARSNSLRCSSPPRLYNREPQIPNSVQEETTQQQQQHMQPHPMLPGHHQHAPTQQQQQQQYPLVHQLDPNIRKIQPQPPLNNSAPPLNVQYNPMLQNNNNNINNNNSVAFNGKQQPQMPPQAGVYGNLHQNAAHHHAQQPAHLQGPLQLQQHHFQQHQQQQQQQLLNSAPLRLQQDIANNNPSRGSVTSSANSMGGGVGGGLPPSMLHNPPTVATSSAALNGANSKQEQRLTHEQFRAALQMVVSQGDPRDNLENFIKIGEGSTGTVWIALEKSTSKLHAIDCPFFANVT
jgi:p21-activated kinase 7